MASAFAHALMAVTIGKTYSKKVVSAKFWILGCTCAVIPDLDVMMNNFVDYGSFFGHRGFFHSFFFCLLLAIIIVSVFYRNEKLFGPTGLKYIFFFFLCGASHALLDMLTTGGMGVAIFSPFDNERYFFPWRVIKVSPMSISRFFTGRGIEILKSELIWVGIPCAIYILLITFVRKK